MSYSEGQKVVPNLPFLFQRLFLIILTNPLMVLIVFGVYRTMSLGVPSPVSYFGTNFIYYGNITKEKNGNL